MSKVNATLAALIATSTTPAVRRCLDDAMWQGHPALSRASVIIDAASAAAAEAKCPVSTALVEVMGLAIAQAQRAERLEMEMAELLNRFEGDGDGLDE